jgi:hypothetical protein
MGIKGTVRTFPTWIANCFERLDLNHGPITKSCEQPAIETTFQTRSMLFEADQITDTSGVNDGLLDELVAKLMTDVEARDAQNPRSRRQSYLALASFSPAPSRLPENIFSGGKNVTPPANFKHQRE